MRRSRPVFHSGTKQEDSRSAEVVAVDTENDLAILKVTGRGLPQSLDLSQQPKLTETMPVLTFGFPFGEVLATSKGSPAITVGKASISSLRMDDEGELCVVQIDGAMNPGNSGGPVVDAQGHLVGVAVATIRNSSGIGLAIPSRQVLQLLQGRLGEVHLRVVEEKNRRTIHVEVALVDPFHKVKSATLHYAPVEQLKTKPDSKTSVEKMPGSQKLTLKIEKNLAVGEFTFKGTAPLPIFVCQGVATVASNKRAVSNSQVRTAVPDASALVKSRGGSTSTNTNRSMPSEKKSSPRKEADVSAVGSASDPQFTESAPKGGLLIGFDVGLGSFAGQDQIHAIRPIFLSAHGKEVQGKQHGTDMSRPVQVKAKPGYAVGSILVKTGSSVEGFSVTFMQILKGALNSKESYKSDWIGGKGGWTETVQGGTGMAVIGVLGRETSQNCTALGLQMAPGPLSSAATLPKMPAPEKPQRTEVLRRLKEEYGKEWADAKTLEKKRSLARKLAGDADDLENDAVGRFLLYKLAFDVAMQAGDYRTAAQAIDKQADSYDVDALQLKAEAIQAMAKKAQSAPEHKSVARAALTLLDQAASDDRSEMARELGTLAESAASQAEDEFLLKRVQERVGKLQ